MNYYCYEFDEMYIVFHLMTCSSMLLHYLLYVIHFMNSLACIISLMNCSLICAMCLIKLFIDIIHVRNCFSLTCYPLDELDISMRYPFNELFIHLCYPLDEMFISMLSIWWTTDWYLLHSYRARGSHWERTTLPWRQPGQTSFVSSSTRNRNWNLKSSFLASNHLPHPPTPPPQYASNCLAILRV